MQNERDRPKLTKTDLEELRSHIIDAVCEEMARYSRDGRYYFERQAIPESEAWLIAADGAESALRRCSFAKGIRLKPIGSRARSRSA